MMKFRPWAAGFLLVLLTGMTAAPPAGRADVDGASATEAKPLDAAPAQHGYAVLMPNAQVPKAPAPLDANVRKELLKNLGGTGEGAGKSPQEGAWDHLQFSANRLYEQGRGYLMLTRALSVHPESNIQFESDPAAVAGLKLNVQEGQRYLVDFAVHAGGSGSYRVATDSAAVDFPDENAGLQHVLVSLTATGSGWVTVRLTRSGSGYRLYSVEITRAT